MLVVIAILLGLILLALVDRNAATAAVGYGLGCVVLLLGIAIALTLIVGAFVWGWNTPVMGNDDTSRFLVGAAFSAPPVYGVWWTVDRFLRD